MNADLVVLTVLPEEYAAVLSCLVAPRLLPGSATTPNLYAWRLGTIDAPRYGASFQIAVGKGTQTPTFGALAAREAIDLFRPSYIAFVGIAGGFDLDHQRHGDVAVSSLVVGYEYGKVDTGGFASRGDFAYRCNEALVRASEALQATGEHWWHNDDNPTGRPTVRTGMIASGDKVIDDADEAFFAAVRARWPKLLAVEMEGAGVAAAVHEVQARFSVGFVLVRGISDVPHSHAPGARANSEVRDRWKVTASRNAARFLAHLVATGWPVPPRNTRGAEPPGDAAGNDPLTGAADTPGPRPQPLPAYPSAEIEALSKRHDGALARKHKLRDAGLATDEVDREIRALRRELRDGGQLRAGDSLSEGRYLLIKPLGRGGFAVVWEALDRIERRHVAIKVLHPHLAVDPQRRERFFRGARVMMSLTHSAVVRVHDPRGEDDAFCYFVMELVPGGNLRDAVLSKRVESARVLPLILQVGEALAEAHRRQLVHRDIKPTNILLDENGAAQLTDFDLVGTHDTTGGTRTGALGTVVYAAPECLDRPQEATARADVFGLGMTAIFCLSGRDLSMATFRNPEATVARLDCSALVSKVLVQAVEWEPDHRFADAAAMVSALRDALDRASQRAPADADRARSERVRSVSPLAPDTRLAADESAAANAGYPRRFGKYYLLGLLAQGGLGALYLAVGEYRDPRRLMVIKTVLPHLADAEDVARFRDEAKVVVKLSHGNLIPVVDAGVVGGELFFAMDFVEGRDLRAVWNRCAKKQVAFPIDVAVYIVKELCCGLAYAHAFPDLHLVQRDISPPNVLVSYTGEVKLTDFGLASSTLKIEKTAPGIIYGKVAYLSPEQARGEKLDDRSDMYAAAIVLWELLTGRQLFPPGKDESQDLLARANNPQPMRPSKRAPRVPVELDEICLRALAPSRDDRYADCDAMRMALQSWLAQHAPTTDGRRMSAFMLELFAADIQRERADREELLRGLSRWSER